MHGTKEPEMPVLQRAAIEYRRRVIIDVLDSERGHAHNVHVLSAVLAEFGEEVPTGEVDELLDWLVGEGLVEIACEWEPRTARVTEKGASVAAGRLAVEGVARRPD